MSIGTRIGRNGVQEIDGASGCQVSAHSNNSGFAPYKVESSGSVVLGGSFTVSAPGFYWISGSATTTGTLPAPASHPGGMFMFREVSGSTAAAAFLLTGSARSAAAGVFCANGAGAGSVSGSTFGGTTIASGFGASLRVGDKLTVPGIGSVCLWSDGAFYVPMAASGSLQIQA